MKDTNDDSCLNYNSICPLRYKEGLIKTFLHRAFALSSDWKSFHIEIKRIKELLVNNNYPIALIDRLTNNFINSKFTTNINNQEDAIIQLYFKGQMTS